MEIDVSLSTTVGAKTMASTSVVDVTLLVIGVVRGGTDGMAEMSTAVFGRSTTVAIVAAVMGVTSVVEVKMGLSDSAVAGEVTTEAIAEVRAGFVSVGATLVVADITVESWGVELRSSSVTTVAEVTAVLGVTSEVEVKMVIRGKTAASEGTTVAVAGTRVTELNTVEGVLLLLTVNWGLLDSTLEMRLRSLRSAEAASVRSREVRANVSLGGSTDVEAALVRSADAQTRSAVTSGSRGTSGLGETTVRSCGSSSVVERSATMVRCVTGRSTISMGSPFSSGGSGNNSSESESLEHLTIKYIKSLELSFL